MPALRGSPLLAECPRGAVGVHHRPGDVFADRYRIVRRISDASMGIVHEALDTATGERVALKTVPVERSDDPEIALRLQLEGFALALIDHPGVVALREHGVGHDSPPFLALELLEGETWETEIERAGPQPIGRAARIGTDVCEALGAVHDAGVVHRDLKSEHVFVLDGAIRLFDFGLARLPSGEDWFPCYLTIGTPEYMAPEQWAGADVDLRADLFSLGAVLYEALTGALAFEGETPEAVMRAVRSRMPQLRLRELRPELPAPIGDVLGAMLEKHPEHRPRSCAEVRDVLARFADPPESLRRSDVATRDA